jgi:hypothetical protein
VETTLTISTQSDFDREVKMSGDSNYALEKLSLAVFYLAIGQGDVRRRLKSAYMKFHPVTRDDFPPHLRDDWDWIINQLTRFGPVNHPDGTVVIGSVDNTLNRIKNSTGAKVAEKIVSLQSELEDYVAKERAKSNH